MLSDRGCLDPIRVDVVIVMPPTPAPDAHRRKHLGFGLLPQPIQSRSLAMLRRFRKEPVPALDPSSFPFLRLPRELREMIYDYFRQDPASDIQILSTHVGPYIEFDCLPPYKNDPVFQQPPASSGLLAYHGTYPHLALRLTCKQIHDELWDYFLSTTFEVGPITPHSDEWRFDPTYQKLATSKRLPLLRKVLVRIDLASLKMTTHLGSLRYEEIELEECALKLHSLAEMLVRVLRRQGKNLQYVIIDWKDDFPEENSQLKTSVLLPFGTLKDVQMRLGKLVVADQGRVAVKKMLDETLEGLSAMN